MSTTASELTMRVTVTTALAVLPLALAGGWLAGTPGAAGGGGGGALALFSFRLLAARAAAATPPAPWIVTPGLRLAPGGPVAARPVLHRRAPPLAPLAGPRLLPRVR